MDRQHAHQLLDRLGPSQFDAVAKLLEVMIRDDDEELTGEDRRAINASREYFQQNPEGGIPFEQVAAECGFTMEQIREHSEESRRWQPVSNGGERT
jgi:hypothetical protein